MFQARDVMTPNPASVSSQSNVEDVVEFFLQNSFSSAPVLDDSGRVLGQLSELNLMRAFVKVEVSQSQNQKLIEFKSLFMEPQFVETSTSLPEVVTALIRCPLHRVLVKNGAGKLVGIISPKDILRRFKGADRQNLQSKLKDLEGEVKKLSHHLKDTQADMDLYKRLFESSPVMTHSVDQKGVILMANPLLHEFLGYDPGELVGQSIFDLYPESLHHEVQQGLQEVIEQGKHALSYSSFKSKSGEVCRVEVISSSLMNDRGEFVGTLTLSRPVDGDQLLRSLHGILS